MNQSKKITYLALGDSYTIGEAVDPQQSFPFLLSTLLRDQGYVMDEPRVVAKTGWTTSELLQAMEQTELEVEYDLVTLLIGVNNQYRGLSIIDYEVELTTLLKKAIALAAGKPCKVIVLSIPDYGYTPFGKAHKAKISKEIDAFNEVNQKVAKMLKVNYLDITPTSRRGEEDSPLIAGDGLHPSAPMYRLWVKDLLPKAKEALGCD